MKATLFTLLLLAGMGFSFGQATAPRPCANPDVYRNNPIAPGGKVFEQWIQGVERAEEAKAVQDADELYHIPVVVHILHNGEPEGTDKNLSLARIQSQIDILNNDYSRASGTPGFNTHPAGADTRIRFCLATIDPNGNPTNGIVRVNTGRDGFEFLSENTLLKNLSFWNPNKYLNIWVCKILGNQYIGYAQYPIIPVSLIDSLPMISPIPDVQPDGVVIDYRVFGDVPAGQSGPFPAYNKGRTATHEIGHYLGLIHIWGDGSSCTDNATDYCADTPPQATYTSGCPTSSTGSCTPGVPVMKENYLDYTNDVCMNLFTQDQKRRMRMVLRNCDRRRTLLQSPTACGIADSNPVVIPEFTGFAVKNDLVATEITVQIPDSESISSIYLFTTEGKFIPFSSRSNESISTLTVANLARGIYTVQVRSKSGKIYTRRFARW